MSKAWDMYKEEEDAQDNHFFFNNVGNQYCHYLGVLNSYSNYPIQKATPKLVT